MRRLVTTGARVAFAALTGIGCAAIIGAEDLQKVDCLAAGDDACTEDASTAPVSTTTGGSTGNTSDERDATTLPPPGNTAGDSAADKGASDPPDARGDATGTEADAARDTGVVEAGCGPTNTTSNCGACGNACNTSTSTAQSCNGTKCGYTCKAGRASCDTSGADLNGCECATPGCCSGSCQTVHNNGQGKAYYDCTPVNTYNEAQARAACLAYTGDASQCNLLLCVAGGYNLICSTTNPTSCGCWDFSSGAKGRTHVNNAPGLPNCWCPDTNDSSWN